MVNPIRVFCYFFGSGCIATSAIAALAREYAISACFAYVGYEWVSLGWEGVP